jgi:hypothetical protein
MILLIFLFLDIEHSLLLGSPGVSHVARLVRDADHLDAELQ